MGVFAGTLPWALSPDLSAMCERNKEFQLCPVPANQLCPVCLSLGMDYPLTNQPSTKT